MPVLPVFRGGGRAYAAWSILAGEIAVVFCAAAQRAPSSFISNTTYLIVGRFRDERVFFRILGHGLGSFSRHRREVRGKRLQPPNVFRDFRMIYNAFAMEIHRGVLGYVSDLHLARHVFPEAMEDRPIILGPVVRAAPLEAADHYTLLIAVRHLCGHAKFPHLVRHNFSHASFTQLPVELGPVSKPKVEQYFAWACHQKPGMGAHQIADTVHGEFIPLVALVRQLGIVRAEPQYPHPFLCVPAAFVNLVRKLRVASERLSQQTCAIQLAKVAMFPELRLIKKQPMLITCVHHLPPAKFATLRRELRALPEKIAPSGAIQLAPVAERRLRGVPEQQLDPFAAVKLRVVTFRHG